MDDFNEVHVVSDLHLGGTDGHQIFKGDELLGGLINSLAEGENRKVALGHQWRLHRFSGGADSDLDPR
jgi:hypothetical protein